MGAAAAASAMRVWGANDKINLGIVGLGGRGGSHMNGFGRNQGVRIAGLCDIDQAAREKGVALVVKNGAAEPPKDYEDMREMFSKGGVDAVSIATPNHWHALATIWAMMAVCSSSFFSLREISASM